MITVGATSSPTVVHAVLAVTMLSAALAVKHLIADFLLQTNWMARGKERAAGWLAPLTAHVLCHVVLTFLIVMAVAPALWWLAGIDFCIHMAVDRSKTLIAHRGKWKPDQAEFWWLLGIDQCLHQLTNVALAAAIVLL